jgi:multiple sugar transport system permease protein
VSERRLAWILCAPAALVMLLVAGYPIAHAIWLSLHRYDLRFPEQRELVGLANYATVLQSRLWWHALEITLLLTIVTVTIELVLGMALAWVMQRTRFARGAVRAAALVPYGIVSVAAAFSWRFAWTPGTGYLAHLAGGAPLADEAPALLIIVLAEVWKTTPFLALLLLAGLALVPEELERAATMDGAGAWRRFTKVILPVMKPTIVVALLFRTLDAFRIFDNVFVLTGGARDTRSVSMLAYDNLIRGLNLGIGATMSVLIFLAVALIALVIVKLGATS